MRIAVVVLRLAVAAGIVAAILGQLLTSLGYWRDVVGISDPTIQLVSFFSFFTIESNILAVGVLVAGAVLLLMRRDEDPPWFLRFRLCVVTYMVTTGVVYNLLLRGIALPQGTTLGWSNEVLHVVGPVWMLLDWLFAPGRARLRWRSTWLVIVFPVAWAIYTLIRGPLVHDVVQQRAYWYPYPFLDPNLAPEGYWSVAFYIVLISAVIGLTGLGAVWVSRTTPLHARRAWSE
ncbi:hypothetical protein GCM10009785_34210 [Brooklawnia cerclae]|uniref:Pr6Pr family membrane protein n=1 Tax=Brooklawnia cerclae TaxID=349934 RepID=A0ABX0SAH9_9ACTN|nr:Pr6Pr family membrane protein [Brooklawnia cerclae]NIH55413.1 hypothetical protein [Brooklawnia cerclae]